MIQRVLKIGVGVLAATALLMPLSLSAQAIVPFPKVPGMTPELEALQKQLQRVLEQNALRNKALFPEVPGMPPEFEALQKELQRALELQAQLNRGGLQRNTGAAGQLRWGGLRLRKATQAQQEELGLPEKEGLVVTAVDPNSPAEKAGLKANDVVIKINDKPVPNDGIDFAKLVKDQDAATPLDLVVVRDGKEQPIKGAAMPQVVQAANPGGFRRPGLGGFGGIIIRGININPRVPMPNPIIPNFPNPFLPQGKAQNLQLEMNVNGAKISRKQTADAFSGEYSKDELKLTVTGTMKDGQATPTEFTVQDGKDTKKYTKLADVPAQHRATMLQIMPSAGFPALPIIPGLDDN